jgi:hypothetical protein
MALSTCQSRRVLRVLRVGDQLPLQPKERWTEFAALQIETLGAPQCPQVP